MAALALLAAACGQTSVEREAAGGEAAPTVAVTTAAVADAQLATTFEAGGVVRARTTTAIAARVMAPVIAVHVRVGDRVHRGTTLITLDARELSAQTARSRAAVLASEETARAAAAQRTAAEAGLTLARATSARVTSLFDTQSATAQERDQADAALRGAEAAVAVAHAQALAAAAARDAAHAGAEAADIGLSYAVLAAPFDGVVAVRTTDPGALAMPGAPLLILEDQGRERLEVTVDEARAVGLTAGAPVDIRIDGRDTPWTTGTAAEIGTLDPATHSLVVKIDLPAGTNARTGTFGRARFAGPPRRALTVTSASLVRRGQLTFVYLLEDGTLARLRPVMPGTSVGDRTEILAGLSAGDQVVLAPPPTLRDGSAVTADRAPQAATAAGDR